jgi:hypothetical protein
MNEKKGLFARAADRLRRPPERKPEIIERGPLEHADDGNLHASEAHESGISRRDDGHAGKERVAVDIERDNRAGKSEELDRGYGDRSSREV